MGSQNNMVAVPVEPTDAMLDAAGKADEPCLTMRDEYRAIWAAMLNAARLAQPDAQQGASAPASGEGVEGCPHEAWNENGMSRRCVDCGKSLPDITRLAAAVTQPAVPQEVAASGLDAATIERCAQVCEQQARDFLSPQYAANQPLSSLAERFAAGECASAIRDLLNGETAHD